MFKNFAREYFSFTKKERTGIIIVLITMLIIVLLPFAYPFFKQKKTYDHTAFEKQISQLKIKQTDSGDARSFKNFDDDNYTNYYEPSDKNYTALRSELFYFDPNTASADDWKRLGVKDKTVATIKKYLSKGGHFYKPEDIRKIWGIRPDLQERLLPYIRIESTQKQYADNFDNKTENKPYTSTYTKPVVQNVEINNSDTTAFITLPGIGSKLAQRIITFRDKLGGFYSVEQIKETYGLPDSTFQKIKPKLLLTNTAVKKININTASLDEMKSHPYLRFNLSNAIVQYRTLHGNYASVNDLKKIIIITDEIFNKLSPYLVVN